MPAINFASSERGFIFLDMKIKGENHRFLLDTGAEGTLLAPELTKGFAHFRPLVTSGAGGQTLTHTFNVNFKLLGKTLTEVGNTPALFENFSREMGFKVSGLIGQDLLRQFSSYTIDNKKGQFIFTL